MIDASSIYTAKRAQNVMEDKDIKIVFGLFTAYEDKVERVKIVETDAIKAHDYSLAVNNYIEKKAQETVPPEVVRQQYFEAYAEMLAAEDRMRKLLLEGGYVHEQEDQP